MKTDRRRFNFNSMVFISLVFLFGLSMYNQRLILSNNHKLDNIEQKLDDLFKPINETELPKWEGK